MQIGQVAHIASLKGQILVPKIEGCDPAAVCLRHGDTLTPTENPFLNRTQAGVIADWQGILPRDFQTVVVLGIVRGRNLYRSLEPLGRSGIVDIRRSGQT